MFGVAERRTTSRLQSQGERKEASSSSSSSWEPRDHYRVEFQENPNPTNIREDQRDLNIESDLIVIGFKPINGSGVEIMKYIRGFIPD